MLDGLGMIKKKEELYREAKVEPAVVLLMVYMAVKMLMYIRIPKHCYMV